VNVSVPLQFRSGVYVTVVPLVVTVPWVPFVLAVTVTV